MRKLVTILVPFLVSMRVVSASAVPWVLLGIRVWTSQAFLVHQVVMVMAGGSLVATLSGAWWSGIAEQVAASGWGSGVQALCPVLLTLGLFARPAAFAMLLQTFLLTLPHESGSGLPWVLLLSAVVASGPGPLSLDRMLRPATRSAALPGLRAIATAYRQATAVLEPLYLLGLRLVLAVSIVAEQGHPTMMRLPGSERLIAGLPAAPALLVALLLALGLGVQPVALILLVLTPLWMHAAALGEMLFWLLLLALLAARGGGTWALDRLLWTWLRAAPVPGHAGGLPHVVIVGGGFGGVAAAEGLAGAPCNVTLIDRRNYHLFQPLLYQVATAGLSPADIATPIRGMLRQQANLRVLLGEVTGVDTAARQVVLGDRRIGYDSLILATGAQHSYFGRDEWGAFAPGLKTIDDATAVRRKLLVAFERAENLDDPAERQAWLTFVIVGGGPTGVELAGAIAELARFGMEGEFRSIDPASARVVLVQAGPVLLPSFPPGLSAETARALRHLGVDIRLNARVTGIDDNAVTIGEERLPSRTVLWAAGVMASAAGAWLGAQSDRAGRVVVGADLRVPGCGEVYAIGDTALSNGWKDQPVPGLAPAAKQGGAYVARVIRAKLSGRTPPGAFRYRHLGSLATIGRRAAVAEFGWLRVSGALAWWLWGAVHVLFLVGGRNRVSVVLQWLWDYLTFRRGTRLITGAGSV